jgi:hypothetical protein
MAVRSGQGGSHWHYQAAHHFWSLPLWDPSKDPWNPAQNMSLSGPTVQNWLKAAPEGGISHASPATQVAMGSSGKRRAGAGRCAGWCALGRQVWDSVNQCSQGTVLIITTGRGTFLQEASHDQGCR